MGDRASRKAKLAPTDTGLYEALQRFWQKSYAGDYAGFILLLAAYLVIQFLGEPFHRHFRLNDPRLQFPHAEAERVPVCTSSARDTRSLEWLRMPPKCTGTCTDFRVSFQYG
jgi:hypothetical protein